MVAAYDAVMPTVVGQFIPPVVQVANETSREERAWIREMVEASAIELRRRGLIVSPAVIPGDPRSALIEEARIWRADCIFVGVRGLSRLDRFLLGSVSAAVAARAHCSVEIVRAKAAKKEK
jgi:nucleotide-binding universal stress UspA family protein